MQTTQTNNEARSSASLPRAHLHDSNKAKNWSRLASYSKSQALTSWATRQSSYVRTTSHAEVLVPAGSKISTRPLTARLEATRRVDECETEGETQIRGRWLI